MTLADTLHRYRIAVFLALAGLVVGLGLLAWREGPRLPEAYRYRFGGLLEARSQTRRSAYQAEIAFYQERLRRNPDSGLDLAALAGVYLKKGRVTGQSSWYLLAQQAAERSLEALPFFNTGALLVLAEIAEAQHDFGGAARIAGEILKEGRSNPAARALLASVYLAQGRLEPAERVAEELVAQNPTPGHLVQRALVRLAQGQDAQALADFRQAVALEEPDDFYGAARTRSLLGRYHLRHGEAGLARGLLEEALRIALNYPLALLYLAELETRQGRYRAAEKLYQRILPQDRQTYQLYDHAAYTGLARLARLQGSPREEAAWERAESVLRREIGQGAFGHRRELARLLLERGRQADFPEALRLAPWRQWTCAQAMVGADQDRAGVRALESGGVGHYPGGLERQCLHRPLQCTVPASSCRALLQRHAASSLARLRPPGGGAGPVRYCHGQHRTDRDALARCSQFSQSPGTTLFATRLLFGRAGDAGRGAGGTGRQRASVLCPGSAPPGPERGGGPDHAIGPKRDNPGSVSGGVGAPGSGGHSSCQRPKLPHGELVRRPSVSSGDTYNHRSSHLSQLPPSTPSRASAGTKSPILARSPGWFKPSGFSFMPKPPSKSEPRPTLSQPMRRATW
ncbi:Lipopolysaccharide assembly protein B [Calidithermus roseus]|uniref:Lipopolysaccharide assembly protein B n=1 Tax=Calidithermus roseus TaxID=1644118 RepID=A0A399ECN0_9DEIN|nr:Lipopolysaccharide assembly protein B [Calidithermus roseus]